MAMSSNTGEGTPSTEATLQDAIRELSGVTATLGNLVFRERPAVPEKEPMADDRIIQARNDIQKANTRLMKIAQTLELLGK